MILSICKEEKKVKVMDFVDSLILQLVINRNLSNINIYIYIFNIQIKLLIKYQWYRVS